MQLHSSSTAHFYVTRSLAVVISCRFFVLKADEVAEHCRICLIEHYSVTQQGCNKFHAQIFLNSKYYLSRVFSEV